MFQVKELVGIVKRRAVSAEKGHVHVGKTTRQNGLSIRDHKGRTNFQKRPQTLTSPKREVIRSPLVEFRETSRRDRRQTLQKLQGSNVEPAAAQQTEAVKAAHSDRAGSGHDPSSLASSFVSSYLFRYSSIEVELISILVCRGMVPSTSSLLPRALAI